MIAINNSARFSDAIPASEDEYVPSVIDWHSSIAFSSRLSFLLSLSDTSNQKPNCS
jgi:hypothetical protein